MKIRLLDLAERDLADGARFYEAQQPGLGGHFLHALFSDIDALVLYAGVHVKKSGLHRALSHRFPYAVYYSTGTRFAAALCSTAAATRSGSRNASRAAEAANQRAQLSALNSGNLRLPFQPANTRTTIYKA